MPGWAHEGVWEVHGEAQEVDVQPLLSEVQLDAGLRVRGDHQGGRGVQVPADRSDRGGARRSLLATGVGHELVLLELLLLPRAPDDGYRVPEEGVLSHVWYVDVPGLWPRWHTAPGQDQRDGGLPVMKGEVWQYPENKIAPWDSYGVKPY